jgi:fructokinase
VSKHVAGTGFATLDRIYTGLFERPMEALGGSCANVLVSLAMLGHRVSPILTLGADDIGRRLFNEMRRAGCATKYVFREADAESPVTIELLDLSDARHSFSSVCPETQRSFASYHPLEERRAKEAERTIRSAAVFYVDRLTRTTLQAMEEASEAGAIVFFEPNAIKDVELFHRAMAFVDILKISAEVATDLDFASVEERPAYLITTYGSSGLSFRTASDQRQLPSFAAPRLIDTCGAGDMVTTGLIHALMSASSSRRSIALQDVYTGLLMGQWLAAQNCAFIGARGLFHAFDGRTIREALECVPHKALDVSQVAPTAGYGAQAASS